jgi:hypothetical protein
LALVFEFFNPDEACGNELQEIKAVVYVNEWDDVDNPNNYIKM